jgi:hypothetical protein
MPAIFGLNVSFLIDFWEHISVQKIQGVSGRLTSPFTKIKGIPEFEGCHA